MKVLVNEESSVHVFLPSFGVPKNEMISEAERSAVSLWYRDEYRWWGYSTVVST